MDYKYKSRGVWYSRSCVSSRNNPPFLATPFVLSDTGVCMAEHESNFNTQAFNGKNDNGSSDYGIFQINSKWWCKNNSSPSANACNTMCSRFLDDNISDDITCAKRVVKDPNGMSAWVAWVRHCRNKDLSRYLASCNL
uniref:Glycosyl hydrolases family 22 (GH22) domain-containing protein n=1 Tax=Panthera leo TaxID=9689 RepID=A0A8C9D3V7_PANLE